MPRRSKAKAKPNWPPKLNLDPYGDGAPVVIKDVSFAPLEPVEELPKPQLDGEDEVRRRTGRRMA